MAKNLKSIHEYVKKQIEGSNAKYILAVDRHNRKETFEAGDCVLIVLTKDCYPAGEYNKISETKIGPCEG